MGVGGSCLDNPRPIEDDVVSVVCNKGSDEDRLLFNVCCDVVVNEESWGPTEEKGEEPLLTWPEP